MNQLRFCIIVLTFLITISAPCIAETIKLPPLDQSWPPKGGVEITFTSAEQAADWMKENHYLLDPIRKSGEVPPAYSMNLPHNLAKQTVDIKTRVFVKLLLPSIVAANGRIVEQRETLLALQAAKKSGDLTAKQQQWITELSEHYGGSSLTIDELLLRVDTVPVDLTLAQGIDESGWGTSHFAIAGNALFGQHASKHGGGKVMTTPGGHVKVAAFDSIYASVASYFHNINSTHAYHGLRELRAKLRKEGNVTGHDLAGALIHYSERGEEYIRDLRSIISHRHLEDLEHVRLDHSATTVIHFHRPS